MQVFFIRVKIARDTIGSGEASIKAVASSRSLMNSLGEKLLRTHVRFVHHSLAGSKRRLSTLSLARARRRVFSGISCDVQFSSNLAERHAQIANESEQFHFAAARAVTSRLFAIRTSPALNARTHRFYLRFASISLIPRVCVYRRAVFNSPRQSIASDHASQPIRREPITSGRRASCVNKHRTISGKLLNEPSPLIKLV